MIVIKMAEGERKKSAIPIKRDMDRIDNVIILLRERFPQVIEASELETLVRADVLPIELLKHNKTFQLYLY